MNNIKKTIVFAFLLITVITVKAQELIQNKEATKVSFKIKNFGVYADGTLPEVIINSNFNTKNLANSYIKGIVKVNAINTENTKRDAHLRKAEFFDVESYPNIILQSTKIEKQSANTYTLTANLTIKKTTKTIVIPIKVVETEKTIQINTNFEINRLDYDVGEDSWVLSDDVKITIVYSAKQ